MRRLLAPLPLAGVLGVAALIALLAYALAQNGSSDSIDSALARGERPAAPGVTLPRLGVPGDGALANYRGKVVVVNFCSSWCVPGKGKTPLLAPCQRGTPPP